MALFENLFSPNYGTAAWTRKQIRKEKQDLEASIAAQEAEISDELQKDLGDKIPPKPENIKLNQVKSGFNNIMSGIQNWNQSEGDRLFGQLKGVGGDFLNAATSSGKFNLGAGLKGSAGGLAALGGDLVSKWGQKSAVSKYGENITSAQNNTRSAIRQGIASLGPIGWGVAAVTGVVDAIGAATGAELSNIDKGAAQRAGIKGTGVQNTLNYIPGVSTLAGATGWALGVDRTSSFGMSDEAEAMAPGYAGTVNDMRAAEQLGNKRFLTRKQTNKAQGFVDEATANNQILAQLNVTNTMRKNSDYYQDLAHQNINRYAGENYLSMRMGREGLKLMPAEEIRAILAKRKTEKLQNGGTIGTPGIDSSVMPTGNLHKELNHMEDVNPELAEEITRKGIPVVSVTEDGEFQQIAEIERDEFIMSKSLTDEIERLYKIGDDEAMIACGKLVANEIIDNTSDPNNVIENG